MGSTVKETVFKKKIKMKQMKQNTWKENAGNKWPKRDSGVIRIQNKSWRTTRQDGIK